MFSQGGSDEVNFDELVGDILQNPERLLDESLTAEQLLEIQKRINPYAGIAGPAPAPEKKRIAAVSYTNLREDYLRRFTATSLIGYIYQMLKEWDVPAEARRWTPASARSSPRPSRRSRTRSPSSRPTPTTWSGHRPPAGPPNAN